MVNPEIKKNNGLKLNAGDTLQMQYVGDQAKARYYVRLIGYLPGQSLIVTTPRSEGKIMLVREGQGFVIRLLAGNAVFGFAASVLRVSARPYPYLHLSYPKEIESTVIRNAHRVATKLIASIQNVEPEKAHDKPKPAVIIDMSTTGAMVTATQPLGEKGDTLTVGVRLTVGGIEHFLTLPVQIRRIDVASQAKDAGSAGYTYGLEFQIIDEADKLVLHGFVYEQLINNSLR